MSENKNTGIGAWGSGLFGFLAGLFIGLVILGWWLWPVQWTNGTYEILIPEQQEDFLRAAINSYTLEPDADLANQRYQGLGQYGPSTLGAISAEPGAQSAAEIEGFAAAVGATEAIQNPPERPTEGSTAELAVGRAIASPLAAGLLILLILVLAALLILTLLRRAGRKSQTKAETIEVSPDLASPVIAEATLDTEPLQVAAETTELETADQAEALPDWLQEPPPEEGEAIEPVETGTESIEEEEKSLSDEDIAEITSSQFSPSQEGQAMPDFLKDASLGEAAVVLAAGAGLAAAALEGEEEGEDEPVAAESIETLPLAEGTLLGETTLETEDVLEAETEEAVSEPTLVEETRDEDAALSELLDIEIQETQAEAHAKFGQDIQSVTGIGPAYGEKLRLAGITSPLLLLRNGATAKGRQKISEESGLSEKLILKWVNFVDLYRIKGVSEAYAELLEAAGVDTVPELATRNPSNLHAKLLEVIEQKRIYRTPPELSAVESWVAQAKKLPRAIQY